MIVLYDIALLLITIIFQTTLTEFVAEVAGAKPDLVLILVVSLGVLRGKRAGAIYGWLLGLLQDGLSGSLLGQNALSKGLIGFAAGAVHGNLGGYTAIAPLVLTPLATLFDAAIHLGTAFLLYTTPVRQGAWKTLGVLLSLNTAIGP
ncbi:MAG: rod shape-determining protein MreD, partial [Nitrospinota bacterium]